MPHLHHESLQDQRLDAVRKKENYPALHRAPPNVSGEALAIKGSVTG